MNYKEHVYSIRQFNTINYSFKNEHRVKTKRLLFNKKWTLKASQHITFGLDIDYTSINDIVSTAYVGQNLLLQDLPSVDSMR